MRSITLPAALFLGSIVLAACNRAPQNKESKSSPAAADKKVEKQASNAPPPPCGAVDVEGENVPLDCNTPDYGKIPNASTVPFRIELEKKDDDAPATEQFAKKKKKKTKPKTVDHRKDGTEGPVRNQGPVGACTAFSLATAIDHDLAREHDLDKPVSVMHLWSRYAEPSMVAAAKANRDKPIALESVWKYDPEDACAWFDPDKCKTGCGKPSSYCGEEPDKKTFKKANKKAIAQVSEIVKLDLDDPDAWRDAIGKGNDIWFAMKVVPQFAKVHDDEIPDFNAASSPSAHAMVLAGFRTSDGEKQFLIHNSWGKKWGDEGYAWISEKTLVKNIIYAYLVEVEPLDDADTGTKKKKSKYSKMGANALVECIDPMVPDSVTKQCVNPCGDGSPPADGACGTDASTCKENETSVAGKCVAAAPTKKGGDPKTGVSWLCGDAGCTYKIPKGQFGCTKTVCEHSCAAPRYLMSYSTENGVSCTE